MKKRLSEIIESAIQNYRNATKELWNYQQYYKLLKESIMQRDEIDREEYEAGSLLSAKDLNLKM